MQPLRQSMKLCVIRTRVSTCFVFARLSHNTLWPSNNHSAGSGSLTAALEVASGRKATVIGKPSRFMFECISSQFTGVDPAQCLMIGDRLETDMLFGSNCGLDTMLTLTGVSQIEEAQEYRNSELTTDHSLVPDYVVDTIADFLPAFEELDEQSNWWVIFASSREHHPYWFQVQCFRSGNGGKNMEIEDFHKELLAIKNARCWRSTDNVVTRTECFILKSPIWPSAYLSVSSSAVPICDLKFLCCCTCLISYTALVHEVY